MDERPPFNLRDALLHRWSVVVAAVSILALIACALYVVLPRSYEATAIIYLDTARTATDFDSGISAGDLLQHDLIAFANTRATLVEACQAQGVECAPEDLVAPEQTIGKRVSASINRGTSSLAVTAKASTPEQAAALANAVARAVIDQDAMEVARLLKPARDDLATTIQSLLDAMSAEQQALKASAPASAAAAAHQAQLSTLQTQYSQTVARQLDLSQRQDRLTNVAAIQQSALPPDSPESPNLVKYLLAALVAGLFAGLFAALVIERFDDRIMGAESLASAAGIPLAFVSTGRRRALPMLKVSRHGSSAYSLALASVLARPAEARGVMVVAASARDHSDPVAARLGEEVAGAGQSVAVLQADGSSNGHDLASESEVAGMTTIRVPAGDGALPALTVTEVFRRNAIELAPHSMVLVSVPSPDTTPAALMFGRTVRRAMLVATRGSTRFGDARRTARLLRESGVDVAAGILVDG